MTRTVILDGARTPFGKLGGNISSLSATQLGGVVIREALTRSKVDPGEVGEVIMGNVLQAGQGQIPSRQAAREAGIPWRVKSETINKVCASGMRSVVLADLLIRSGEEEIIVAGGMESMSNTPYAVSSTRFGARMGNTQMIDLLIHDGLSCSFTGVHMGTYGNRTADEFNLSREEQDKWAVRSHFLAIKARKSGALSDEIVPVSVPQRKGESVLIEHDEGPREDTTVEVLSQLRPAFEKDGTITAGNAPGVNDGAAALVLMNEERALNEKKDVLATIIAHAEIAVEASRFPETPGLVINKLLDKTNKTIDDIDLFEVNEAFAAVALASVEIANIPSDKINVNGGAIALGHPIGASGTRVILTLAYELKRRGGGIGIASICSGSGQGDAIMIEVN
ncbi:acetyl-CoA C-acetyltransferase [Peribacillus asahii]|uniref:acetyl-CoA C-acetyltransferase n=1 Tax=Peribacillus asahii TaxID=228899 RepID=A0A398B7G2_9BACI|nr:acetyl-CoA C-acetyltransferase [Peribacillus asahii]RID85434.1 acetyl-CoA C-acetyltransferase [Peribacillus asahii]